MTIRKHVLTTLLLLASLSATAASFKGVVVDKTDKQPLIGVAVTVDGTTKGTSTDAEGRFELHLDEGDYKITVSYISYATVNLSVRVADGTDEMRIEMEPESEQLSAVTVKTRRDLESERVLQRERMTSEIAVENMGAKEMALKGISDVQEGVKKISGISIASAGQIVVRGLGDRYSITTLNGQPIASPNPDNKLIPLDIFPSSAVKNITVSKVYEAGSFADYSGAHINIDTKENTGGDFFGIDFSAGGNTNTLGRGFYRMDHRSLFTSPAVDPAVERMSRQEFRQYVRTKDIFDTGFSVERKTALPVFGGNIGFGRDFSVGRQTLSVLASAGASNDMQRMADAEYRRLEATGSVTDEYVYDSYAAYLKMAALGSVSLSMRDADRIGYTFFYARNAVDTYMLREGFDQEGHRLTGSNDVMHIYRLTTHQINGRHEFGDRWSVRWSASYTATSSDEPDRRQAMFIRNPDGSTGLFKLNS